MLEAAMKPGDLVVIRNTCTLEDGGSLGVSRVGFGLEGEICVVIQVPHFVWQGLKILHPRCGICWTTQINVGLVDAPG